MEMPRDIEEVHSTVERIMEDPLAKILITNSHLTKIQAETLLIDILTENIMIKKMVNEEKAKIRLSKTGVSRGAFNRTLKQANKNIISSIYTLFLLGYLRILESPKLTPFMEIGNKLEEYANAYNDIWNDLKTNRLNENKVKAIASMKKELEITLSELVNLNYRRE